MLISELREIWERPRLGLTDELLSPEPRTLSEHNLQLIMRMPRSTVTEIVMDMCRDNQAMLQQIQDGLDRRSRPNED